MAEKNPIISYEPNKPLMRNSPYINNRLKAVMAKYNLRPLHAHRGDFPTEKNRREVNLENQIIKHGIIYKVEEKYCKDNFLPPPQIQNFQQLQDLK
jgi:hypothetical protein